MNHETSQKLPDTFLENLASIIGKENLLLEEADRWAYGYDNSRQHALPDAVAFATSHEQVQAIINTCKEQNIPVIARGRGTGTTGATVPVSGGLVLSLERMKRILRVDPENRLMVVEPGVTNQEIQEAAAQHGFFWPPDPTSASFCTVGGNLAYNSAGPRAVKYGTPRENTLGLKAITGTGETIHTGVFTTKGVVGYDLTRLLIGSEGTLAIITEAILKLTPLPEAKRTMQAIYEDMHAAAAAVSRIMAQPVIPCALEFIDGTAIDMIRDYSDAHLPENAGAMLMIEVDGSIACLDNSMEAVKKAAEGNGLLELNIANTKEEIQTLWNTRKALSPALRKIAPKKINEDVVVPVSRIPELIAGLKELSRKYEIPIVNFGHAGNGNIHTNLLIDPDDPRQMQNAETCLGEVFQLVLDLEGTISGEHGIGLVKKEYINQEIDPVTLELMRKIKQQFDPQNLLNPDKALPSRQA